MRFWKRGVLCLLLLAVCLMGFPMQAQGAAADHPDYAFITIDADTITPQSNSGKAALIVFADLHTGHQDAAVATLLAADWVRTAGISVIVVDWTAESPEDVISGVLANDAQGTTLQFCMDKGDGLRSFLTAAGLSSNTVTLPASFLVDESGKVQGHMMGESSDNAFRQLLSGRVAGVEAEKTVTLSVAGENVYSEAFEILKLMNKQRAAQGLSALTMDKSLLDAAMLRAAECNVYYSHTRPNGEQCFSAFPSFGGMLAENIAIGYRSAADVMDGWMNSPGHRANILTQEFESVGIGVFRHDGVYSWVQLFSSEPADQVKAPADTAKTAKIEILQENLNCEVSALQMKIAQDANGYIFFSVNNVGYPYHNVRLSRLDVTYRSDNKEVATVDVDGVVTAVAPGKAHITATLNGTDISEVIAVEVGEHNYVENIQRHPTCAQTGLAQYVCSDCGHTQTQEIPKLTTHSWDDGEITRQPTAEKEGEKTFTCTVCAKTKTERIPKLSAPTESPTMPETKAPTAAPAVPATTPPTVETRAPTEPTAIPIPEPTDLPLTEPTAEITEPMESTPEFVPGTQPTQSQTQPPTTPENLPARQPDSKLPAGIIVAVVATLAAGAFLLFWKRKK